MTKVPGIDLGLDVTDTIQRIATYRLKIRKPTFDTDTVTMKALLPIREDEEPKEGWEVVKVSDDYYWAVKLKVCDEHCAVLIQYKSCTYMFTHCAYLTCVLPWCYCRTTISLAPH